MRVFLLSEAKMEQNTSAWILSAEISLECGAGLNTVRLSHRGCLIFSPPSFVLQTVEKMNQYLYISTNLFRNGN